MVKILDEGLMKARISREEFESNLRLSGTDDILILDHPI